jgi:hypothetical protein
VKKMSFSIYDVTDLNDAEVERIPHERVELDDPVEMGLSSGEVRQAILDRVREEVQSLEFAYIDTWFPDEVEPDSVLLSEESSCRESFIRDISEALYSLDDQELDNRVMTFSNEIIAVRLEDL